jgi:hypothetical protein
LCVTFDLGNRHPLHFSHCVTRYGPARQRQDG